MPGVSGVAGVEGEASGQLGSPVSPILDRLTATSRGSGSMESCAEVLEEWVP